MLFMVAELSLTAGDHLSLLLTFPAEFLKITLTFF